MARSFGLRVLLRSFRSFCFFFFNDTATTEIYTLSLHDALPISLTIATSARHPPSASCAGWAGRSEEHTSELQSRSDLVCRLLLEQKKTTNNTNTRTDHNNKKDNTPNNVHSA